MSGLNQDQKKSKPTLSSGTLKEIFDMQVGAALPDPKKQSHLLPLFFQIDRPSTAELLLTLDFSDLEDILKHFLPSLSAEDFVEAKKKSIAHAFLSGLTQYQKKENALITQTYVKKILDMQVGTASSKAQQPESILRLFFKVDIEKTKNLLFQALSSNYLADTIIQLLQSVTAEELSEKRDHKMSIAEAILAGLAENPMSIKLFTLKILETPLTIQGKEVTTFQQFVKTNLLNTLKLLFCLKDKNDQYYAEMKAFLKKQS
ncbi:MAG: hypothetical protein AAF335_01370 [Bacteroidota bacterium]